MVILYVFIVLLVLLTLLSTFGGSIKSKETFVEETTIDTGLIPETTKYTTTETFLASPPFNISTAPYGNSSTISGNTIASGSSGISPTPSPIPLNLPRTGPAPYLSPSASPVRLYEKFMDSPLTGVPPPMGGVVPPMGGVVPPTGGVVPPTGGVVPPMGATIPTLPGAPASFPVSNATVSGSNVTFSPSPSMIPSSMSILNNIQIPKIETFVDPYDSSDKHAKL